MSPVTVVSSANLITRLPGCSETQSNVNSEYSFGESGQPCGVPVLSTSVEETALPIFTTCGRSRRKFKSQLQSLSGKFRSFISFEYNLHGMIVLNAEL